MCGALDCRTQDYTARECVVEGAMLQQLLQRLLGVGLFGFCLVCSAQVSASTELVSRIVGEPPIANGPNRETFGQSISADGRFVAFISNSTNLSEDISSAFRNDLYVYDRLVGTTELLTPGASASSSSPAISADGRYVAFTSRANNLVSGDTGDLTDVFLHDRMTSTTQALTLGGNSTSFDVSISADGRYVVFSSNATNLVPNDNNGFTDIFVYDRDTDTTALVTNGSNFSSSEASISADGRFVAFRSGASSLVSGDSNRQFDIFVFDRATNTTEQLTTGSNDQSNDPAISADGQFVAFSSKASNLVVGDTNGHRDIFVHNRATGETRLLTKVGDDDSADPSISADGQLVAFDSQANNLIPGDPDIPQSFFTLASSAFIFDQATDSISRITPNLDGSIGFNPSISADGQLVAFQTDTTVLLPTDLNDSRDVLIYNRAADNFERLATGIEYEVAGGNADSAEPSVSGNGRFVAYESNASDLVIGDTNFRSDIFVYDRETGSNDRITTGLNLDSVDPAISADGQFVVFEARPRNTSISGNLAATRIFVHNRNTQTTQALTPVGNRPSFNPSISGDGRFIVFESQDPDLVPDDTNNETSDIFLYDRETNLTQLLTAGGNGESQTPVISADGRFVAFSSEANNLVASDTPGAVFDIFVYDRISGTTEVLTQGGNNASLLPAISADGSFVAFASHASNLVDVPGEIPNRTFIDRDVFVHNRNLSTTTALTPRIDGGIFRGVSISANGRFVAFYGPARALGFPTASVLVYDQITATYEAVAEGADTTQHGLTTSLSGNGSVVAFSSLALSLANDGTVNINDVFVSTLDSAPNNPPVADPLSVTTNEDTPLELTITASDADSDALVFEVLTRPANGELTGTAPDFVYTPVADFFGTDSFTFSINDGSESSEPATVSIEVVGVNDSPVGSGVGIGRGIEEGQGTTTLNAPTNTPLSLTLLGLDADGDQLAFTIIALPENGALTGLLPDLVYTPDADYLGPDSFAYTVSDGEGTSESITISLTVVDATVDLLSAVLPASRSVEVGTTATAFATLINAGTADAQGCGLRLPDRVAAEFFYQASDSATNAVVGEPNALVDIPAGGSQSFIFGITPSEELSGTEIALEFQCANATDAASFVGLNTLLLSASLAPVPDLIALAATPTNNGVTELGNNSGFFTASTINVGSRATITVSADTGDAALPVTLSLCQTDPTTSVCINPTAPTSGPVLVDIDEGGTPTFAVFVSATDAIALDPTNSRVFIRFSDVFGVVRGATSVAVQNTP